ncbi:Recombinase [Propionibacterium freudenreichii]|uniref:recombinase family protein n=1 Tax=Propionibacterium freudenreichii TaxID=1744 RepID=UPI0005429AE2
MTSDDADEAAIDSLVAPTPFAGAIAVSYLRVSTKEQAEKGGNAEGFSIPAQREANQRKADQLGATIVEEFVDAGESARKADRPELMRMIKYVATHKTSYCIVHKVDRLARNRADDVTIHLALKDAGVTLVSATENIDETPSGMLLHGIMSSIAEFYSRNLATEVVKGLSQKAAQGGTVTKAPIGYRNVGIRDDMGREIRTVEVDEERAKLVRWAFQVFASGDWTTSQLHKELVARGLTTLPTPRRPSKPIAKSTVHRMLTNPYYKGVIVYQGVTPWCPRSHRPCRSVGTGPDRAGRPHVRRRCHPGSRPLPQGQCLLRAVRFPSHRLQRQVQSGHHLPVLRVLCPPCWTG